MSVKFFDSLKRKRDICVKPKLSGEKMAFRLTPALSESLRNLEIKVKDDLR